MVDATMQPHSEVRNSRKLTCEKITLGGSAITEVRKITIVSKNITVIVLFTTCGTHVVTIDSRKSHIDDCDFSPSKMKSDSLSTITTCTILTTSTNETTFELYFAAIHQKGQKGINHRSSEGIRDP